MDVTRVALAVDGVPSGSVNAYLVGDEPALLVDPGRQTEALDDAVGARDVGAITVTHTHADHAGALAHYARSTGATVYARRWREAHFRRATGVTPDRTLLEGDRIPVGSGPGAGALGAGEPEADSSETSVAVLATPGHVADHLSFVTPSGVFCGDLAVAEGSVAVLAPDGDMRAYLTSLRRLYARNPAALFPGHGPLVDDPRATLGRLVTHRRQREARVVAAVAAGARTLSEILDAAYDKDVSGVRAMATATIRAHLEKLDVEGRVRWDPVSGQARPA